MCCIEYVGVVELEDTLDLGSSAARCKSLNLYVRTIYAERSVGG